jgi:RNA polymerase primary sigma factor
MQDQQTQPSLLPDHADSLDCVDAPVRVTASASPDSPEGVDWPAGPDGAQTRPRRDGLDAYLAEIGTVPLLTAQEEIELGRRIAAGIEAAAALRGADAEGAQAAQWARLVRDGQRARGDLVQGNLRLVVSIAKRYTGHGLALLDLIQEGNLGLIRAAEKFDYTRGIRFSTYATWWIRQAVIRSLANHARTMRLPIHTVEAVQRVVRTSDALTQERQCHPTANEIGDRLGVSGDTVASLLVALRPLVPLDAPAHGESGPLADRVADELSPTPDEACQRALRREALLAALQVLSRRERAVIARRFGFSGGESCTLAEVGRELSLTRERVRQIEARALHKLRRDPRTHLQQWFAD